MIGILGPGNALRISFSLAALIFSLILYILVVMLGTGQVHKNLKFRTLVIVVVLGNLISILDFVFRMSGVFVTNPAIRLVLFLLVFQFNIFLTYFIALYMEGFFPEFANRARIDRINRYVVISSVICVVAVLIYRLFIYQGPGAPEQIPMWVNILLAYVYELYFLIYAICLFIFKGRTLSKRARYTAIAAYVVCIAGVVGEVFNTLGKGPGIFFNYFGAVIGLYIFYIGVETPDYQNLLQSVKDLKEAREEAVDANMAKSAFLANMSHEIRTPINAVIGMNEMILRESSEETVLGYARDIEGAGKNLLSIINDILDLSKIEAGRMEILNEEYSLKKLINDVVNMISFKCREKNLDFLIEIEPKLPEALFGDEVRVRQVLVNLLNNAVKYTNGGSVTLSVFGERTGDFVPLNLSVKDTGIGIKDEDIDRIFGKFDRVDTERNKSIEGTGLGLAITSGLVSAMGGSIRVSSRYGAGSEFVVSIPQKIADDTPVGRYDEGFKNSGDRHEEKYHESFRAPGALILHVDDTPLNHTVMKSLLKKTGVKIDMAMNGPESVAMADEKKYDLIFMDYRMPHMDGVEALKTIRSNENSPNADTPVICLTADAVSGARDRYLAEGFTDYLTKPLDAGLLEEIMIKYLPDDKKVSTDDKK